MIRFTVIGCAQKICIRFSILLLFESGIAIICLRDMSVFYFFIFIFIFIFLFLFFIFIFL